jgi:hypothetical protein
MPKGKPYTRDIRAQVYHQYQLGKSVADVQEAIFCSDLNRGGSKLYIKSLFRKFGRDNSDRRRYLEGPTGDKTVKVSRKLNGTDVDELVAIRTTYNGVSWKSLTNKFNQQWLGQARSVSKMTVHRAMRRRKWSRKSFTRRSYRENPIAQLQFVQRMSRYHPRLLKDIDEAHMDPDEYKQRFGYAPIGQDAIRMQFEIADERFSVIAMLGYYFLESFKITQDGVDAQAFQNFVDTQCAPILVPGEIVLVDNATIHTALDSRASLEAATNGRWILAPAYSPRLKPVELLFALVKKYLRDNELEATRNPLQFLRQAFKQYCAGGSRTHIVPSLWKPYLRAHQSYLHSL